MKNPVLLAALTLVYFATQSIVLSQADTTSLEQLQDCVRTRYARSLEADLTDLEYSNKGEWLKYLPNLGVTYTVAGEPRPAVSTSTNVFYQAKRDKKVRAANKSAAVKRNQLALDTELAALSRLRKQ